MQLKRLILASALTAGCVLPALSMATIGYNSFTLTLKNVPTDLAQCVDYESNINIESADIRFYKSPICSGQPTDHLLLNAPTDICQASATPGSTAVPSDQIQMIMSNIIHFNPKHTKPNYNCMDVLYKVTTPDGQTRDYQSTPVTMHVFAHRTDGKFDVSFFTKKATATFPRIPAV
jgi:hypothetical protein